MLDFETRIEKLKIFVGYPGSGKTTAVKKYANNNPLHTLVLTRSSVDEYSDLIGEDNEIIHIDIFDIDAACTLGEKIRLGQYERIIIDDMEALMEVQANMGEAEAEKMQAALDSSDAEMLITTKADTYVSMLMEAGAKLPAFFATVLIAEYGKGVMVEHQSEEPLPFSGI